MRPKTYKNSILHHYFRSFKTKGLIKMADSRNEPEAVSTLFQVQKAYQGALAMQDLKFNHPKPANNVFKQRILGKNLKNT